MWLVGEDWQTRCVVMIGLIMHSLRLADVLQFGKGSLLALATVYVVLVLVKDGLEGLLLAGYHSRQGQP